MAAEKKFAIVGLGVVNGRGLAPELAYVAGRGSAPRDRGCGTEQERHRRRDQRARLVARCPAQARWVDGFSRILGLPAKFYWSMGTRRLRFADRPRSGNAGARNRHCELCGGRLRRCRVERRAWETRRQPDGRGRAGRGNYVLGNEMLGFSGAATAGGLHAFFATRHMYEYGTKSEHFGAIAVSCRQWACLNPEAQMHGRPITIEDHQNSPLIVEPYHLLDCCLDSDAGVAVVITKAERAKELKKPPVFVMGLGFGDHARSSGGTRRIIPSSMSRPPRKPLSGRRELR